MNEAAPMTSYTIQNWTVTPLIERVAREFTPAEWKTYQEKHPGAKKEDHTIREPEKGKGKEEEPKAQAGAKEVNDALKAVKPKVEGHFKEKIGEKAKDISKAIGDVLDSEGGFMKVLPTAGAAVGAAVGAALGPEAIDAMNSVFGQASDLATMLPGIKGTLLAGGVGAAMGAIPGSIATMVGLGALGKLAEKLAEWLGPKGKKAADLSDMPDDLKAALLDYFTSVTQDELDLAKKSKSKENAAELAAEVIQKETKKKDEPEEEVEPEEESEEKSEKTAFERKWAAMEGSVISAGRSFANLQALLALLQAQYIHYQAAHWATFGAPFYGNHLMFQRIYEAIQEEVDTLGEKLVAFFGRDAVEPTVLQGMVQGWLKRWAPIGCFRLRSIQSEKDFQAGLSQVHGQLKSEGTLTLGLEDFLAAMGNNHETNTYLVQQSLGGLQRQAALVEAWGPGEELPGEMMPLEKSWGGYSSFSPIRRGEEDEEEEEVEADDLALDATWDDTANDEGYFHPAPQWSELRELAQSRERMKPEPDGEEPFEGWTLSQPLRTRRDYASG